MCQRISKDVELLQGTRHEDGYLLNLIVVKVEVLEDRELPETQKGEIRDVVPVEVHFENRGGAASQSRFLDQVQNAVHDIDTLESEVAEDTILKDADVRVVGDNESSELLVRDVRLEDLSKLLLILDKRAVHVHGAELFVEDALAWQDVFGIRTCVFSGMSSSKATPGFLILTQRIS